LVVAALVLVLPHEPVVEPAPAAPAPVEDPAAVRVWWLGGGQAAMSAIAGATTKITDASGAGDVDALRRACLDLGSAVAAGRTIASPPSAEAREHWSGVLDDFGATAAGCADLVAGVATGGERVSAALDSAVVHVNALADLVGG
ncbi:MAG TPA: hypothetical protein VNO31_24910, partial [Umezawaea sp.]|nr:hypothetical protein [Umezawaea sp.]